MVGVECITECPERAERKVQRVGEHKNAVFPGERMNDQILIKRLKEGDPGAFDELVDQYKNQLFAFIIRIVTDHAAAEDIFQETWIKVIRSVGRFRGDSKLSTWLFQIALNQCRDAMRKKGRHIHVSLEAAEEIAGKPTMDVEKMATSDQVRKMVGELPDKMREAVVLKYYHDLNDLEISEVIGCPEGTVKSRLHRAAKILRKKWTLMESF